MPPKNTRCILATTAMIALLAACGDVSNTQDAVDQVVGDVEEQLAVIETRQDNFEGIGDGFKLIRANFEEGATTDLAAVEAAARDINERANRIGDHFPEGSGRDAGWDTEALATIWEKPVEFTSAQQKLLEESAIMMELAASGDAAATGAQIAELGGACKNCHDTFRYDDEK